MKKPKKCCEVGEHTCTVPMPILGRSREEDIMHYGLKNPSTYNIDVHE